MRNLRTCVISRKDLALCAHDEIVNRMKRAGIKFAREGCPTKLAQPWDAVEDSEGTVTWTQWEHDA